MILLRDINAVEKNVSIVHARRKFEHFLVHEASIQIQNNY